MKFSLIVQQVRVPGASRIPPISILGHLYVRSIAISAEICETSRFPCDGTAEHSYVQPPVDSSWVAQGCNLQNPYCSELPAAGKEITRDPVPRAQGMIPEGTRQHVCHPVQVLVRVLVTSTSKSDRRGGATRGAQRARDSINNINTANFFNR